MEIEARGLYLPIWGALNDTGDATEGIPGLCVAEDPLPDKKGAWKGNPGCCELAPAEDVGIGGEKGSGGYWFIMPGAGDAEAMPSGWS
jgi:hypothetical protein